MNLDKLRETFEGSGESAAIAVFDHLETVASNGPEYSTKAYLLDEAIAIRDWANIAVVALGGESTSPISKLPSG